MIFFSKNNRKCLAIALKCMRDGENRISFIKDVEVADGKADIIYSVLSNEIEKYGRVESMSGFGSDGPSIIMEHKKVASKLERD